MRNIVVLIFSFACIQAFSQAYNVGDVAQGGVVFWVDETGLHGLVCAMYPESHDDIPRTVWMYPEYYPLSGQPVYKPISGAYANGIGAGLMNTSLILAQYDHGRTLENVTYNEEDEIGDTLIENRKYDALIAAEYCVFYRSEQDGLMYGDWYLPSPFEMDLLFRQVKTVNKILSANSALSISTSYAYWTSTQYKLTKAYHTAYSATDLPALRSSLTENLVSSTVVKSDKNNKAMICPIRKF